MLPSEVVLTPIYGILKIMTKIIDTTHPNYIAHRKVFMPKNKGVYNGAYYYSTEIVKNIIPHIKTWRPWDTLGMKFIGSMDHAIVFLHHNLNHDIVYSWLDKYKDLVYISSTEQTHQWASQRRNGHAVLLPLSIDIEYVSQFKTDKTKEVCYAGNRWDFKKKDLKRYIPEGVDFPPEDIPREELLEFIAPYKVCYAIGRTAMEAAALECEVKNCDSRYDGVIWKVRDNSEVIPLLQEKLDCLDSLGHLPCHLDKPHSH